MSGESIASEVLSASVGGIISTSVLYPLEVLKTKMQAETKSKVAAAAKDSTIQEKEDDKEQQQQEADEEDKSNLTMVGYASRLYQEEGFGVFMAGFEMSAFRSATEKALYFFAYTGLKGIYRGLFLHNSDGASTAPPQISTIPSLVLGCLAEWMHLPITLPLDCWTTAIQTNRDKTKGPMQLLLTILSAKGLKGMYKGIQAYTVLCFKPALQYTVFEQIKSILVRHRPSGKLHAAESFVLGMLARTVSTVCIFPYLRAKVVLQTATPATTANSARSPTSIPELLTEMYREGGIATWFQGLGPELTRGVLSSALMLMIKEQIANMVQSTLVGQSNTQRILKSRSNFKRELQQRQRR